MPVQFSSQHTASFPQLLTQTGRSLLVSTYNAGQLILLRAQPDGLLNTHFCALPKPMGFVLDQRRASVGTGAQVLEYRNMPAVAPKVTGPATHDAAYLPRKSHITGDIDIHEMAYDGEGELWLVNTRMSCLCTLDWEHSIVPQWRPPFISGYDLTDRCHLNGLAMRDGKPGYVSALGDTDTAAGWRANKAGGGLLIDVPQNKIVCRGLSMPHSPRWYQEQLWCLESGSGSLLKIDPATGSKTTVVQLPGFTRGLDFVGQYAIIGLSQVRETNVFAGLPLTRRVSDRKCGIWVVDILSGNIVAFVEFDGEVREIFAVQAVPFRFPVFLEPDNPLLNTSYALPDQVLKDVAPPNPAAQALERATALQVAGQFEQALVEYAKVFALQPEHVQAHFQCGVGYNDNRQWQNALESMTRVIGLQPHHAEALNGMGLAKTGLGDWDEALEWFSKAIEADQSFALAHFNRGLVNLKLGHFKLGWEGFEWRWQLPEFTPFQCPQPQWDGEDIRDKALLIHSEQGAGDTIQYARFLPIVARRCKRLVVVCTNHLRALLETVEGVAEVLPPGPLPPQLFDCYLPIMSLTRILAIDADNLPANVPYLAPPPNLTINRVAPSERLKIGLVWKGSPTHKREDVRACGLDAMRGLVNNQADFYSLQTPVDSVELQTLEQAGIKQLEASELHLTHFGKTAALIEQLDLVISIDTSVAHLAGALGKPVWILLDHSPDWRWLTDGEASAWYPSARLLRKSRDTDWDDFILGSVKPLLENLPQPGSITAV